MGPAIIFVKRYSPELCRSYPHIRFVYGDNYEDFVAQKEGRKAKGYKGQAEIRNCKNTYGVPTKERAARTPGSYWKDADFDRQKKIIDEAFSILLEGGPLVIAFPADGLGTGLAQLDQRSPKTFTYLVQRIRELTTDSLMGVSPGGWFNSQPGFKELAPTTKTRIVKEIARRLAIRLAAVRPGVWVPLKRFFPPAGGPDVFDEQFASHIVKDIIDGAIAKHGPNARSYRDLRKDGFYYSWGYAR